MQPERPLAHMIARLARDATDKFEFFNDFIKARI